MTDQFISIDDFAKVDIRVGHVLEATNVPNSEKLIRLVVDFGEFGKRIIFTGVRMFGYTVRTFKNKQFFFCVNLVPRRMPSYIETPTGKVVEESQGMIIAVDGQDGKPLFVSGKSLPVGAKIR